MKMYGHKLSIWIPIMVLLSCSLYLVNTYTVVICGQVLNSAGSKNIDDTYLFHIYNILIFIYIYFFIIYVLYNLFNFVW